MKKFSENINESGSPYSKIEKRVISDLYVIMDNFLDLKDVRYTEDVEIDTKSVQKASEEILEYIKNRIGQNIIFQVNED